MYGSRDNKRWEIFPAQETAPNWALLISSNVGNNHSSLGVNDTNYAHSRMSSDFSVRIREKVMGPFQPMSN